MDRAIAEQFGPDHFVTAQMMDLDVTTGQLQWVNAGHPAPLLIRNQQVAGPLEGPTTLPVGLGGEHPAVSEHQLQRGDRVLCYTDGVIEERNAEGEPFGEERLIRCVNAIGHTHAEGQTRAGALRLSHALKQERAGRTSDDATVFLIHWRGGAADHLAIPA
jgi:serine phosphatase RsbU (regulator of sigma subunit)